MALILGLDIRPHVVRGVLLRAQFRRTTVERVLEYRVGEATIPPPPPPENYRDPGDGTPGHLAETLEAEAPLFDGAIPPAAPVPGDAPRLEVIGEEPRAEGGSEADGAAGDGEASDGAVPLRDPTGSLVPESELDDVGRTIRRLLRALPRGVDRTIVALAGDQVSLRRVTFPAKVAKKADELLPLELGDLVPFDIEDSVYHQQEMKNADGQLELLAAVAPKERVRAFLDDLLAAGVDPRELSVGPVALDGLPPFQEALGSPGPNVVFDIGADGTDVCVLENGVCQFARSVSVGLTETEERRAASLARELKHTFAAWRRAGGAEPSAFYLAGELGERADAPSWLSELLGVPVEPITLGVIEGAEQLSPAHARAAGLAGRALSRSKRIDLRQGEFVAVRAVTAIRRHMPLLIGCAAAVMLAFLVSSYARYSVLSSRNDALTEQLAEATELHLGQEISSPEQAMLAIQRGVRGVDPLPSFDAYDALAELSAALPEDIPHDVRQLQLDLGDGEESGRFLLRGTVESIEEVDRVVAALEAHRLVREGPTGEVSERCFRELELSGATRAAGERRAYRLEGSLSCRDENRPDDDDDDSRGRNKNRRRSRR